jgi:Flp pilus assembly protein TadG
MRTGSPDYEPSTKHAATKAGWQPRRVPGLTRRRMRGDRGAELIEMALALPLVLVMVIGVLDFATAFNLKQKLSNAAREGARLGASQPTDDLSTTSPASVQTIKDDVATYLTDAGVNTSFIGTTMTAAGNRAWTYYSKGSYGLKIERSVPLTTANGTLTATRITLTYPYNWLYGFDHIIKLLIPSASSASTITITTDATMYD